MPLILKGLLIRKLIDELDIEDLRSTNSNVVGVTEDGQQPPRHKILVTLNNKHIELDEDLYEIFSLLVDKIKTRSN